MAEPDPEQLLLETRAFNAELERLLGTMPTVDQVPVEESRRARREGRGIWPAPEFIAEARVLEIDGPGGPLGLRVIAPDGPARGAFLHLHGGGWTLGESDMQDLRLQRLARETGLVAVSVGYRLAPENPYPAGPDDCEAAALWLLSRRGSRGGRRPGRAAGDRRRLSRRASRGGHAAAAARSARDHRGVRRRRAPVRRL